MGVTGHIREPAVSGMFYPDDPLTLKADIGNYLKHAEDLFSGGEISGIVSPHAGYIYSGQVAAYGYRAIGGKQYDTVVVIAPSHRTYFNGVALWDKGGFKTPLGVIPVDEQIAEAMLRQAGIVKLNRETHREEHALEVQLPFLQSVLKNFAIVPLVMGVQSIAVCRELSHVIYESIRNEQKKFLIIASTDLSHYYPYKEAMELDGVIAKRLDSFDIDGMIDDIECGKGEACGAGPMITLMYLTKKMGANRSKVLKYANSGDVSGDKSGVVGYISAVFYRDESDDERDR